VEAFSRPRDKDRSLLTIALVNRTPVGGSNDEHCLFQCRLEVRVLLGEQVIAAVLPYPGPQFTHLDDEDQSLSLLYRKWQSFAIGHGCAADWVAETGKGRATAVVAVVLPIVETPSITPDVTTPEGEPLFVEMAALAGLVAGDDGKASLRKLLESYESWIGSCENETAGLPPELRPVAARHTDQCRRALARMRSGMAILESDPLIGMAFKLANRAVLLQQLHSERRPRVITGRKPGGGYAFDREPSEVDVLSS